MNARLKGPELRMFNLVADSLFQGKIASAIETALLDLAIREGVVKLPEAKEPVPFPARGRLLKREQVLSALDELTKFACALGERCKYLIGQKRLAYVQPENIVDLVAAAEAFPHPYAPRRRAVPSPECESKILAFTMRPEHLALSDEVGSKVFGQDGRARRLVWEHALYEYAEKLNITPDDPHPKFQTYPRTELLRVNLYYDRFTQAITEAIIVVGRGVLAHKVKEDECSDLLGVVHKVALLLIHASPTPPDREIDEISSMVLL